MEDGEVISFTIFHVERLADEPPQDYIISLDEDFHQNGIVAELALSDIFSQGPPFDLSILRGIIYLLVYS
jgi:hypothetical protein